MEDKLSLLRDAAKLYYLENLTQAEIATRLNLSRPTVSRLLANARAQGVVKVFISDLEESTDHLEDLFMSLFDLRQVKVVPVPPNDPALAFQYTCRAASRYIEDLLRDGDRIGVGWGGTLYEISKQLQHRSYKQSTVVQLFGNLDTREADDYANDIVSQFTARLEAKSSHIIPCPVIVGNQIISDILMHDEKINQSIKLAKNCNTMLVNIGLPNRENCLYKGGYINDADLQNLATLKAVGCVGCRFYDDAGNICDEQLDNRTIGVSFEDIRQADTVITCVVGSEKAQALLAAVRAGLLDVVIIDSIAAAEVIRLAQQKG